MPFGVGNVASRSAPASRTRFIHDYILERFEQVSWPPPSARDEQGAQPEVRIDLKTKMRGM
jgi:hypothetical protein